jgi:hypothetical protein
MYVTKFCVRSQSGWRSRVGSHPAFGGGVRRGIVRPPAVFLCARWWSSQGAMNLSIRNFEMRGWLRDPQYVQSICCLCAIDCASAARQTAVVPACGLEWRTAWTELNWIGLD